MKLILLFASIAIAMAGCTGRSSGNITGVYTRESAGEYSRAWDTLIIEAYNRAGGIYRIERKTGFIRFKDGVPLAKEFRREEMVTDYNKATRQLTARKTGRLFSFKDAEVLFGSAVYRKE